jgi:predicted proteasome-type protease
MTYCVGVLVRDGLAMIADTRTNAGIDNISIYKKLHVLADNKRQLSGAELYIKDNVISLLPTFEQLDGGLLARSRDSVVLVTVPAGTLKPGTYRAVVVGERTSRAWTVQVH